MRATAKWLVCGAGLSLALGATWAAAGSHHFTNGLAASFSVLGGAGSAADEQSDLLAKARQAMKAGRFDEADALIAQADALNVKHDPLMARWKDSPEKARAELAKLRAQGNTERTPSSRFSAWPPSLNKPEPSMGSASQDPFASRASDATLDKLTNDAKSKAVRYLEQGRNALRQGDIPGAIAFHQKARSENATFGPGEYSPDALANELRAAGVDPSRLPAVQEAPRFAGQDLPQDDRQNLPSYGSRDLKDAFQNAVVDNPNQLPPERNPLARSQGTSEMVHNPNVGRTSALAEARKALAFGDVRRASELASEARQRGEVDEAGLAAIEGLIRRSNELSAGPRPGSDPAQFSRQYAAFLLDQAEGLLACGEVGQAERLAQQAKNLKAPFGPGERTPDALLQQIASAKQAPAATEVASAPAGARRLPTVDAAAPSPLKQEAMQLMAEARLLLDQGNVHRAHHLAQQAQNLRVPEEEFQANETRPWQLLLETSKAVSRRGSFSPVVQAGAVENAGYEGQAGNVRQGVYDPANDPSRNMPASSNQDEPNQLPAAPRARPVWDGDPNTAGQQFYDAGMKAFAAGDRDAALQHFRQAWKYKEQLDPTVLAGMRDKMIALESPRPQRLPDAPSPLGEVDQKTEILRQKISKEIFAEEKAADKMMATDPEGALERMRQLRQRVNAAELDPPTRKQLLSIVDRKINEYDQYIQHNRAEIELNNANRRVRESIARDQERLVETQTKLAELVEEFNKLLDEQRYAEAEVIAKQAREIAPEEPVVQNMVWKAKFVREYAFQMSLRERKNDGFLGALGSVEDSSTPFDDRQPYLIGDAREWVEMTKRRRGMMENMRRKLSPVEQEIHQSLNKQVEVHFVNRPLSEVMDTLGKMANVNIHLDPQGLHAEGVTSDTPVNLNLATPISLKSALNIILDQLRLSYIIKNEVLQITSQQTRDANLVTVVYNVGDLVIPIPNFTPSYNMGLPGAIREAHNTLGYGGAFATMGGTPNLMVAKDNAPSLTRMAMAQQGLSGGMLGMAPGGRPEQFMTGPGSLGGGVQADFDSLIDLITSTVHPESWKEGGGVGEGTIAPFETNLSIVVSQTEEVHQAIADLLDQLRRLQDLQVTIEVRFITLNDNFFERIGVDFDFNIDDNSGLGVLPDDTGPSVVVGLDQQGQVTANRDIQFTQNSFNTAIPQFGGFTPDTAANFGFAILSDIEVFFLLNAATGDTRTNVLQAPKVTLFNGQQAVVSDTSQRPFVTSVIPVVGDFAAAHQPVITVLSEGTSLSVQAVVSSDRRFVRLTLVPFFSEIGDVEEFTFTGRTTTNTGTAVVDPTNPGQTLNNEEETTTEGTTVQLPTFSFTTVTTTVSVPDGGTVLLGGIKRLSEGRTERGVPLLSKVPYASRLFKNVGIGRQTQSLMMMVTPRIIIQEEEEAKLGIDLGN